MSALQRTSAELNSIMRGFTTLMVAVMFVIVIIQVFCRYVLNYSFFWSDELVRYLFIWMAFFGGSVAFKSGEHLTIDVLTRHRGTQFGRILRFFKDVAILWVFVIVIYHGTRLCVTNIPKESITLGVSMAIPYLAVPAGTLAMLVHHLAHMELAFRFATSGQVEPAGPDDLTKSLIN